MQTILVTGGCGYIGAHTIVDLIENGFNVISVDNLSRASDQSIVGIEKITGKKIKNYKVDLTDKVATENIFIENLGITGIIHFAAYKAVGESVELPLEYYENNLFSLVHLLQMSVKYHAKHFIFSSSCTVYGNPDTTRVTEATPLQTAASPYGATKQMGEVIVKDAAHTYPISAILLRYFNPVGAHPSTAIGELPIGRPQNLVPAITQTAIGKLPKMQVHGTDYNTRDGSCIRDYIHVCDIAHAHTLALQYSIKKNQEKSCEVFNLGTGNGITVLEAIQAFEKVSGVKLNYEIGPRRAGDIVAIYANNDKAVKELGWNCKYGLDEMMLTAWQWEQSLAK
ncbi:MAG: UDP-glucose 4-epimerase GalE [Sediminibacterium sp.]|nr:UDP-glucose 4-epimerase GalE [Sediminibacterium sp.]